MMERTVGIAAPANGGICDDYACDDRMLFSEITWKEMPRISEVLGYCRTRTCDFTIGGIYMWVRWFGYRCAFVDGTLFISGMAEDDDGLWPAFSMPVGAMPPHDAVRRLADCCRRESIRPVFSAVPEEYVATVCSVLGPQARVRELVDWADYLYDATDLAVLRGKRFNKKRNHVNRFKADNPGWILEDLTPEIVPEAVLFLSGRRPQGDEEQDMAVYEHCRCVDVLEDWRHYPFEGVVLRGGCGDIVALAVAEVLGDTAFIHIEKANHEVAGAGEAINCFFAAHLLDRHSGIKFINREEDVGDESLRYAKESYHPLTLLRKFNIYG